MLRNYREITGYIPVPGRDNRDSGRREGENEKDRRDNFRQVCV